MFPEMLYIFHLVLEPLATDITFDFACFDTLMDMMKCMSRDSAGLTGHAIFSFSCHFLSTFVMKLAVYPVLIQC